MNTFVCLSSIDHFEEIDHDAIICGGIVKDSLYKSLKRIEKINSSKNRVVSLISKDEVKFFMILRNLYEQENSKISNLQNNMSLDSCIKDKDCFNKFAKKRLEYFADSFYSYIGRDDIPITLEIFELFRKVTEVSSCCYEMELDFSFFNIEEFGEYDIIPEVKHPEILENIIFAYNFNKIIEKYMKTFIDYFEKSQNSYEIKFKDTSILVITDPMTCFKTMFCEEDCNVNQDKLMCVYNSINESNRNFDQYQNDYIITYSHQNEQNTERIYYIPDNSFLIVENGNIYSE